MPDRRDLNRCFPGSAGGSLSSRCAYDLFTEIVTQCDYGLDLHSAASGRTNFPNVRADLDNVGCRKLAEAFGCELIIDGTGPDGSLRRAAVKAGVPTVILEAGEPSKIEPTVLEIGVRGVHNVLGTLGMTDDKPRKPPYQTKVTKTVWTRAQEGGLLRFHVAPGELVDKGQPLATNVGVFGHQQNVLTSPANGIVLGMTTLPLVKPGEPVCHIAVPTEPIRELREALADASNRSLDHRVRRDLATNVTVSDHALTDAELHEEAKPASTGGD
jgi:predicted deacylase